MCYDVHFHCPRCEKGVSGLFVPRLCRNKGYWEKHCENLVIDKKPGKHCWECQIILEELEEAVNTPIQKNYPPDNSPKNGAKGRKKVVGH